MSANVLNLGKVVGQDGLGVPSPAQEDAGKVPTVTPDGSGYELKLPAESSSNYVDLTNKPQINGVELEGNKSAAELGINKIVDIGELSVPSVGTAQIQLDDDLAAKIFDPDVVALRCSFGQDEINLLYKAVDGVLMPSSKMFALVLPTFGLGESTNINFVNTRMIVALCLKEQQVMMVSSITSTPYIEYPDGGDVGQFLVVKGTGKIGFSTAIPTTGMTVKSIGSITSPTTLTISDNFITSAKESLYLRIKISAPTTKAYYLYKTYTGDYYEEFSCTYVDVDNKKLHTIYAQADYKNKQIKFMDVTTQVS